MDRRQAISRRNLLRAGSGAALAAGLGGTVTACGGERTAGGSGGGGSGAGGGDSKKVLVRSTGGVTTEMWKKYCWDPFTKETGIKVVPVAADAAKVRAAVKAGQATPDVLDLTEVATLQLEADKALRKIDYSKLERTDLSTLEFQKPYYLADYVYSTCIGYSKEKFGSAPPKTWADVWDTKKFSGGRTLQGLDSGDVNLEFALLADGVAMKDLYPLDIDRAFKSLKKLAPSVRKYWTTGAETVQLFGGGDVVLGSAWNTRLEELIRGGKPVAIQWNGSQRINQGFSIPVGAQNVENAYKLIDFSIQPKVQADVATHLNVGPGNRKAYEHISDKDTTSLPNSPAHVKESYVFDAAWWVKNFDEVSRRWTQFLAEG